MSAPQQFLFGIRDKKIELNNKDILDSVAKTIFDQQWNVVKC